MNKIATYLNEHLLGEVSSATSLRKKYAVDRGILTLTPEIVAFPRVTNDIRKIARFTWQLAEKGHVVGLVARGYGHNTSSGAIGKGMVIDLSVHLNEVVQIAQKDRLVHVRAGTSLAAVNQALKWQGLTIPGADATGTDDITVGGMIADDTAGTTGFAADSVQRLEVVLANGDIIETGRLSHRDVSKKLGLQTFEGELYRKLSGLIEDNEELIEQLRKDEVRDNIGYARIGSVREKDGSIDLTPLFIGSQGTLGIISEAVLQADFFSDSSTHLAIVAQSLEYARDIADKIQTIEPAELSIFDGELFRRASENGTQFAALGDVSELGAVVYMRFNDFSERSQAHKLKKLRKLLKKIGVGAVDSTERIADDFQVIASVGASLHLGSVDDHIALPVLNGASVPGNRRQEFEEKVAELAARHHVDLPLSLNVITGTYEVFPLLKLDSVSDKQKLFKLMSEFADAVDSCGGAVCTSGGEGRVKAISSWATIGDEKAALYEQIRQIFDPFGTLNPGVKQRVDIRTLVSALRSGFDSADML